MSATLAPEAASTFENSDEPSKMSSATTVTRAAPHMDFQKAAAKSGTKRITARPATARSSLVLNNHCSIGITSRYTNDSKMTPTHP